MKIKKTSSKPQKPSPYPKKHVQKEREVREEYVFLPIQEHQFLYRVGEIRMGHMMKKIALFSSEGSEIFVELAFTHPAYFEIIIGDKVILSEGIFVGICERVNLLGRYKGDVDSRHKRVFQKIATNLDILVIVASARDPKFQPGFIERYLILAQSCNIPTLVAISKSDLSPIDDPILDYYRDHLSLPVVHTSVETGQGIEELRTYIHGKTTAFVGKSGTGKSSLTNAVLSRSQAVASQVSQKGGQGQHTTTSSKMYQWDDGSYVIDTPGIRSLEFLEWSREDLITYFPDLSEIAPHCKYRSCRHGGEDGCALRQAVLQGKISSHRYDTYQRLAGESS